MSDPDKEHKIVELLFCNKDAVDTTTSIFCCTKSVPHILAWYGAYWAGDDYTVTMDGKPLRLDLNGELETEVLNVSPTVLRLV